MSDPIIREIEEADVAAVVALWHAADVTRPWNDPQHDIAFARKSPHATIIVAEHEAAIAASVMVGEDGHRGWMYYLSADPARRGTGLGRAVVTAAETWLAARGIWKINIMFRHDNAAVRGFYEHLGYGESAVRTLQKTIAPGA